MWYYIILIHWENCIKEGKIESIRLITYCCLALALLVAGCTTTEQAPGLEQQEPQPHLSDVQCVGL